MSSGACRALVAVVLTLVATIVMTLPVAARTDELVETSVVTYEVLPSNGRVKATLIFTLTTGQADWQAQRWGPIVGRERDHAEGDRGQEDPGWDERARTRRAVGARRRQDREDPRRT